MASVFEIPLSGQCQTFTALLLGIEYQFAAQWRDAFSTWFLDILDANGKPLLQGLALVQGVNLLHQHQDLGIGGGLFITCDAGIDAPSFDNFGTSSHLVFVTV